MNRRAFLKQAGILLAGGAVVASGIVARVSKYSVAEGVKTYKEGRSYSHFLDDFTFAMERCSPLLMDNLGIQIRQADLNKSYHDYALSLHKADWELTDMERRTAFFNVAMEAARSEVRWYSTQSGSYWGSSDAQG